jgi:hypothetical protein
VRHYVVALGLVGCRIAEPTGHPSPVVEEPVPEPVVFGYVTPGGERSTGLPQIVDKGGPAWIAGVVAYEELIPELAEAVARAGLAEEPGMTDAIESTVITRAAFEAPAPTIWLVDDEGACEARLAKPYVATYFEAVPTVEVGWRLEGCDPERAWGPIGLFTAAPPQGLRWIASEVTFADAVDPQSFTGRGWSELREFAQGFDEPPDEHWVRELSIAGTDIAQVQLAGLWRHHPAPDEEYDDCQEVAQIVEWTGRWRAPGFEPIAASQGDEPWASEVELVGAFVVEGEPRWLVFSAWMQALVVTPGGEPQTLGTGIHHDEVVASSGWSPAASCDP